MTLLPQETIRTKRLGGALSAAQIADFVDGLVNGGWTDAQGAALAMAVVWRGMSTAETAALTEAMTHSGEVLDWRGADIHGPVLDKHSTGGVGDKVSLILAPLVAACGGVVPMISGRGLGHTGGTLDKLQALPGYDTQPTPDTLQAALRQAGCAIVGASARLAPADRRLYALRDETDTVVALPLITASILSKKRAAGLQALVMDVKCGNGAFCTTLEEARDLARSLVDTAHAAGLPTTALITDMNQVLGHTAGNALEVAEALDFLTGRGRRDARLAQVTLALSAELLCLGGLAADAAQAQVLAERALSSGAAAERFARMVAALGGPHDVLANAGLPTAPVQRDVPAPHAGTVCSMDTRALGLAVLALGGGRRQAADNVDVRVGLSHIAPVGRELSVGEPLARVHAACEADAAAAVVAVREAVRVSAAGSTGDTPLQESGLTPQKLVIERVRR